MSKIIELTISDYKRIKAIRLTPSQSGTTIIGGGNSQGKTSVLDALEYLFGGGKHRPSAVQRDGAEEYPKIIATLEGGLTVRRMGKNSSLTVSDDSGMKGGQAMLDKMFNAFALNMTPFLDADPKEKAATVLQIIGVGDELDELDAEEKRLAGERVIVGRDAKQKQAYADGLPSHENTPEAEVSISDLIQQQKEIVAQNTANESMRGRKGSIARSVEEASNIISDLKLRMSEAQKVYADLSKEFGDHVDAPGDRSTDEIESQIANAETINQQVRENNAKVAAGDEATVALKSYNKLNENVEATRAKRTALLDGANMPLPGLTIQDGHLIYNGQKWDCMSQSEQLRVGAAIVRATKPDCGVLLIDGSEKFDIETLCKFNEWAVENDVQVITTRVSTGDECTVVIEDGEITE
ncbi:MAG: chromosome segregation protein SMC [FCB group bacterium]|nr:chromosome segregation protein SMC [FCB group bacterium]